MSVGDLYLSDYSVHWAIKQQEIALRVWHTPKNCKKLDARFLQMSESQ